MAVRLGRDIRSQYGCVHIRSRSVVGMEPISNGFDSPLPIPVMSVHLIADGSSGNNTGRADLHSEA